MPIRAIVWVIAYVAGAILAFVHPIGGLFTYFLDYYAHPPIRWWGKALPDLRWSLTISIVTLLAFFVNRYKLPEIKIKSYPQTKWLFLIVINAIIVTSIFSVLPEKSWDYTFDLAKLNILYFLVLQIVRTKEHFRYFILIQIIGVFLWGWDAYDHPKRVAGRLYSIGGPDSLNDNHAASQLLTILPFIGVVFLYGKRWEKALCMAAIPFVLNAFILCNSRGAFLGLLVTGVAALILSKGVLRWKTLLAMLVAGVLFYNLMDPQFIARQQTIESHEDQAATDRLESWKAGLRLIADHPLGTGGGGFSALSPIYIPEIVEAHQGEERNVHSTYLQAGSEWGIPGLFLFLAALISTCIELHRLRRSPALTPEEQRMHAESLAIELGLIGAMVSGIFTSRLYAEALYWLPALTGVLKNIYAQEREQPPNIIRTPSDETREVCVERMAV
jgi:probable O-glycosylation ligase (exosortase A-associated)